MISMANISTVQMNTSTPPYNQLEKLMHCGTVNIYTENLLLRKFKESDLNSMYRWCSDSNVTKYLKFKAHESIDQTKLSLDRILQNYSNHNFYNWAIVFKETNEVIGSIGIVRLDEEALSGELCFCLDREYWNRGIMTEASKSVVSFAFNKVNFNRIQGMCIPENVSSRKVMTKIGMKHEGLLRQYCKTHTGIIDCDIFSIIKSDLSLSKD